MTFRVYDNLSPTGKPNMGLLWGMRPLRLTLQHGIDEDTFEVNTGTVETQVDNAISAGAELLVFDIEGDFTTLLDPRKVTAGTITDEELEEALTAVKTVLSHARTYAAGRIGIGAYIVALRDYFAAIDSNGGYDAWWAAFDRWNKRLVNGEHQSDPWADYVDAHFPSVYLFYPDGETETYCRENVRAYAAWYPGRPIYAYVWGQFHNGADHDGRFLQERHVTDVLAGVKAGGASGIVMFGMSSISRGYSYRRSATGLTLEDFSGISDGSMRFRSYGWRRTITGVDFTAAEDMDGVASILQAAMQAVVTNTGSDGTDLTKVPGLPTCTWTGTQLEFGVTGTPFSDSESGAATNSTGAYAAHSGGVGTDLAAILGTEDTALTAMNANEYEAYAQGQVHFQGFVAAVEDNYPPVTRIPAVNYIQTVLATSPAADWVFNDPPWPDADTQPDLTGNGHTATWADAWDNSVAVSGPSQIRGIAGAKILTPTTRPNSGDVGVRLRVDLDDLLPLSEFSIMVWADIQSQVQFWGALFDGRRADSAATNAGFALWRLSSTQLMKFEISDGSTLQTLNGSALSLPTGLMCHGATWKQGGQARLYRNGELDAEEAATTGAVNAWGAGDPFLFHRAIVSYAWLLGTFYRITIWDRELSSDEMAELYEAAFAAPATSRIGVGMIGLHRPGRLVRGGQGFEVPDAG